MISNKKYSNDNYQSPIRFLHKIITREYCLLNEKEQDKWNKEYTECLKRGLYIDFPPPDIFGFKYKLFKKIVIYVKITTPIEDRL